MLDEVEFNRRLGAAIARIRSEHRITQAILAQGVSLSRTSVTNIERGTQKLSVYKFLEICGVLRVRPERLLSDASPFDVGEFEALLSKLPADQQRFVRAAMAPMRVEEGSE